MIRHPTDDIQTVTVIGANGTMGRNVAAIFASFGNANVYLVSRTAEKSEAAREVAYKSVRAESVREKMVPTDYSDLRRCIAESDLVFESAAENWDVKADVTKKIAAAAAQDTESNRSTVFCSGTSGLSITKLSELFPENLRGNYMGMHMFNPPYAMSLCEMIPTKYTDPALFEKTKGYCSKALRRTVVEVRDSPAFLANRIGFQFINEAMQCAERYRDNGGIDYIDAVLGPFTGRNMAPLATANFVGLDVHQAIVDNLYANTNDFARETFAMPEFARQLVHQGRLGRKTGGGLYSTYVHDSGARIRQVWDIDAGLYRNIVPYRFPFVDEMISCLREGDYRGAYASLKKNHSPEAELCMHFVLRYILYALKAVELVGYDVHSADDVMVAGFNWCPPLAMIEALGGVNEFRALCLGRVSPGTLEQVDLEKLLAYAESSRYDFRKYVRAKR